MEYNWKELREYRQKEIEEAVILIDDIFKNGTPEYFRGVMDMFTKIMHLPKKLCQPEEREAIEDMVTQEFKSVEIDLLRRAVRE